MTMPNNQALSLMRSRQMRAVITATVLVASLATSGCASVGAAALSAIPTAAATTGAGPGPAQSIATAQPGDSGLSCQDLTAQMAQMDQIAAQRADTGVSAVNFIPVVGDIVSLASINTHANALQDQANLKNQAYQRKQYLLQLYTRKAC
jgi:hypothetical protein